MILFAIAIFVSVSPFLFLLVTWRLLGDFTYTFANVAGLVGGVLLIWQYLLGIRPLAERLFGKQIFRVKLHMAMGIYGMFFVLVHPFLEMFGYGEDLGFVFLPSFATDFDRNIGLGRIAFFILIFIWVTSAIIRNKLSYKTWHRFHYLNYPIMLFVFIHATQIGTILRTFPLIRLYWYVLGGVYVLILVWRAVDILRRLQKSSTS